MADRGTECGAGIADAAALLMRTGVMSLTGHINLSARADAETMLLTPTGLVDEVDAETVVPVTLDGRAGAEQLKPSIREVVGMHSAVYRERPEVGSVLHTHSPHVTAFALAHEPLPCRYEALLRYGQDGPVPVAPWGPRGSDASVRGITDALRGHPGTQAVLLANHGVLAFAGSPVNVAKLLAVLEEAAQGELEAAAVGGAKDLPPSAFDEVHRTMEATSADSGPSAQGTGGAQR